MPDNAPDVSVKISEESDSAARILIDELIYDLLDNEPQEIKRFLLAGETSADYAETAGWYSQLSQYDGDQVNKVIHLSMEHALSLIVMVLDHGKFFVGPGSDNPEEILHYSLYAETYPAPSFYQEGQQPLSRVPINPLKYYEFRLSDMLSEKLKGRIKD